MNRVVSVSVPPIETKTWDRIETGRVSTRSRLKRTVGFQGEQIVSPRPARRGAAVWVATPPGCRPKLWMCCAFSVRAFTDDVRAAECGPPRGRCLSPRQRLRLEALGEPLRPRAQGHRDGSEGKIKEAAHLCAKSLPGLVF
jgi:hypothetical protein